MSTSFQLISPFTPSGDQPAAIDKIVQGLNDGAQHQVLLGVTGSGKTFCLMTKHCLGTDSVKLPFIQEAPVLT